MVTRQLPFTVVNPRLCPRCQSVLHREDEGSLVYCWNCGAPQVLLSEELRNQIDQQLSAQQVSAQAEAHSTSQPLPQPATNAVVWRGAIQCAGLAGAVAALFALVAFAIPPVGLLSFLWFISAPIVILGIYTSRFRQTRVTTGFGARLGLLCGLAILIANSTLNTAGIVLQRFVFHSSSEIDTQLATLFTQMRTTITAEPSPAAKAALDILNVPEFRAGLLLGFIAICLFLYLLFSATAGAFAGYLRSRAR